jgi:hypothetical protein
LIKDSIIFFSIFICLALLALFNVFWSTELNPYDFLVKEYRNEESIMKPYRMIDQVNLEEDEFLVFYINENRNLVCAIIEKGFLTYKILNTSSEISLVCNIKKANTCFCAYDEGRAWIHWGIVRDERVNKILVNGEEATIIYDNLPIFYLVGKGKDTPDKLVYLYFDKYGQLVK